VVWRISITGQAFSAARLVVLTAIVRRATTPNPLSAHASDERCGSNKLVFRIHLLYISYLVS
jgi:hypothetical protein